MAKTAVTVNNVFVPPMTILSINATITYNGVALGTVVSKFFSSPVIPGKSQGKITARLALNTNPLHLIALIRAQAVKNGLNTDALDGLILMQKGGNPPSCVFDGFNAIDFTLKAMVGVAVDIKMTTDVKLGKYRLSLPYMQTGVPTTTDRSILKLLPLIGTPIAQLLVDRSKIAFDTITLVAPSETSFKANRVGAITATGPLDALIAFPHPVIISFDGKIIGSMKMPTVNLVANEGAVLDLKGMDRYQWTLSAKGVVVAAMGAAIPGVIMTKTMTLDGFRKLQGLKIDSYVITRIDAGGLHMVMKATLANPSTLGMTIALSTFQTQFHGKVLGP
ncbi:hypothetical protein BGZ70_009192, partial [Mortierella alpina]